MTEEHYTAHQRLAFGRVAELYDRARPSYPPAAMDAVIAYRGLTPGTRIVEVGAGTGKATVALAQRGLGVLALEPSPDMAAVARANCAPYPAVDILETEFERWEPAEPMAGCVSVQAWHWIDPAVRYAKARQALAPGATLAAVWMLPDWDRCPLRPSLSAAYADAAPGLVADFPMHPDSEPTRLAGDWHGEIAASEGFTAPVVHTYAWRQSYTATAYPELLSTHQDHILLADDARARLMAAVTRTIEQAGGTLELPLITYVCLAARA